MKVSDIRSVNNNPSFGSITIKPQTIEKCKKLVHMSSVGQRVVIGSTALVLQPLIDLKNKKVDKRTREISAVRSIARAAGGTATGIFIRYGCIKLAEACSKAGKAFDFTITEKQTNKLAQAGKQAVKSLAQASDAQIKGYAGVMGTAIALGVMLFTNFLVDVPIINSLQNFLVDKVFKIGKKPEVKDGSN